MKPIAKLDNAKKLIAFTKEIILKNDIVKNNQKVPQGNDLCGTNAL